MNIRNSIVLTVALTMLLVFGGLVNSVEAQTIKTEVVAGGGTESTSSTHTVFGTVGQTASTIVVGGTREVRSGFWQNFQCCMGIRGDIDGDGSDNQVLDMSYLIEFIFRGGPPPICKGEADLDGDGAVGVLDLSFIIDDIFRGGPSPGAC